MWVLDLSLDVCILVSNNNHFVPKLHFFWGGGGDKSMLDPILLPLNL